MISLPITHERTVLDDGRVRVAVSRRGRRSGYTHVYETVLEPYLLERQEFVDKIYSWLEEQLMDQLEYEEDL